MNVLVLGTSVARMVAPGRTSVDDRTYAGWLEELTGARVENESRWYELLDDGSARFHSELRPRMPDVVVLDYGVVECQPSLLPTWLSRHAMTWDQSLGRGARLYRRGLAVVWPALRWWQRWSAAKAGTRTWRLPPRRFAASLHRLIEVARHDKAVVLVLDLPPFGSRMEHFLPGLEPRRKIYNEVFASVVSSFADDDVRLVERSKVSAELGIDETVPDGLHLSPAAHRRVAELLAAELPVAEPR